MNVPHEVGGFVLEHELGRGGMGVVYRARDPRLDRPVALKVILGDPSPQERERFRVEAAAAARLDHPNLVRVLSAGEAQGRPFLALEYVEGESLSQRLRRVGRCDALLAARIVAQLARGVAHAHERGVIHRDIKPDNVLLVGDTPRLTDFGLARLGERHLTQTGTVLGTPAYMAPEQAAGEVDRIGPQSDVYALGAVLYALLAGHPPFRGTSAINTLRRVMDEPPPPIPQLPAGLRKILFRALEKEPAQRTASAADLAWELEGWAREVERPASPAR
ncbi:MAG: serine/threonine protein kinase, partial [Planctomycetes bacterium]|nr:serine/threonine protein kinase [Planctomycetota bacterium]